MGNKKIILVFLLVVVSLFGLSIFAKDKKTNNEQTLSKDQFGGNPSPTPTIAIVPADKLEVIHFHATKQCWTCITVGAYALKTIKEKFPEEYASGKVVFKDINVEEKENQEIVTRYQAGGASLYVNAIRGNKDDIAEDVTVWKLVNDEGQFTAYFESKLKTLLGK